MQRGWPTVDGLRQHRVNVFSFDVTVSSHELLKQGVCEARLFGSQHAHHRIVVAAETRDEAALIACQMAGLHAMCTGLYDRI